MGRLVREGYTPVVPDYRGAGQSDIATGGYDKKAMAGDLQELMTGLKFNNVDIVGHDMGLIIAYAYAAMFPQQVKHVVVMDGFIPGIPGWEVAYNGNPDAGITSKWHFRFFGKTALALVQGREKLYLDMFFDDFVAEGNPKVDPEIRQALIEDYARPGRMEAGFKLYEAWSAQDANDNKQFAKKKLSMPVLTIGGDRSRGKTLAEQVNYISVKPQSLILKNTGHWVLEEQFDLTSNAIVDFLKY